MVLKLLAIFAAVAFVAFNVTQLCFIPATTELASFIRDLPSRDVRLADLHAHIVNVSRLIAVCIAAGATWLVYSWQRGDKSKGRDHPVELFLTGFVPLAAALFFVYQVVAGSLFATVSVTATATRCTGAPNWAMLSVKLERGDKWVVEVPLVTHLARTPGSSVGTWMEVEFPRRGMAPSGGRVSWLRLGPGEETVTMQIIELPSGMGDTMIDVRADSYAVWWPAPSQALTRVILPGSATPEASVLRPAACLQSKETA